MGFRFRKSIKIAPGVKVNLSHKGVGYSVGGKGFTHSRSATGRKTNTVSIPGSGLSYSKTQSTGSRGGGSNKASVFDVVDEVLYDPELAKDPVDFLSDNFTVGELKQRKVCYIVCIVLLALCALLFALFAPIVSVLLVVGCGVFVIMLRKVLKALERVDSGNRK